MKTNLTIDPARLWSDLMETARFGGTPGGGINRQALSVEDGQVRGWFRQQCEALGCTVEIDRFGNMFARRPGQDNSLPAIGFGSHLDTQPTGGKFDGVLGVLAGLEVMRTLHRAGYVTKAPLELVNWTNEEGSRFSPAMQGSAAFASLLTPEATLNATDRDGTRYGDALAAIGYAGELGPGSRFYSAFYELHIEQGPVLEAEEATIGIVEAVQGIRWYDVTMTGTSAHTGATPMHLRRNALVGAARFTDAVEAIGWEVKGGVATVGSMVVKPNARNVVPGEVVMSVDLRHPDDDSLTLMDQKLNAALARIASELHLEQAINCMWYCPPVKFDTTLQAHIASAAAKYGYKTRNLVSGAGHDAACIASIAPTAMLFIPCAGGISHNEAESSTLEDCGAGAQVLLDAILARDETY